MVSMMGNTEYVSGRCNTGLTTPRHAEYQIINLIFTYLLQRIELTQRYYDELPNRQTDGRELCLKDRVKILNFKERAPIKNTHGETNIGIDFESVSIHFPLRWALESINGKRKKIGKDLMKRNKRVQFLSWDKTWKEIVPVVPKLEFKVERENNNMNGGREILDRILRASDLGEYYTTHQAMPSEVPVHR
ncbi:hypothetical protein TNCV_676631 [Trichonephila clavipes]|nr:hypothetical protein TNCV_676631 [Trichonephila clavipes]